MPIQDRKKTPRQLESIKEVQHATEKAMTAVIAYLQTTQEPTSEEAHALIDTVLEEYGCESPEGHIVAGGIESAEPHNMGSGILEKGVPIVIDIYPRSKTTKYFADVSRTVCVGNASPGLQKMYDTVLLAQELAISMVKPKAECNEIQKVVEELFMNAGYITSGKGKEFKFSEGLVHGVGHGLGLSIHEPPRIGRGSTDILEEGDVITIEPGLYYKDKGGIRLEDVLLVTDSGYENLTHFPKQFVI